MKTSEYVAPKPVKSDTNVYSETKVYWECQSCSMNNEASSNRCGSCGKSRYVRSTSIEETSSEMALQKNGESKFYFVIVLSNIIYFRIFFYQLKA